MQEIDEFLRVLEVESQAIVECKKRFQSPENRERLRKVLQVLQEQTEAGGQVIVMGIGKSGKIGQKIAATFSSTGTPSSFVHPTEALHGDLGLIRTKDCVIAISYSGRSQEILDLLPFFKNRNLTVIGIGGDAASPLAENSNYWLDASVLQEACPHQLAPTSSTTLDLAIGDALALALMKARGFSAQDFAANHPAGSLGRRLSLKVKNVMHTGAKLPTCTADTSADQIVELSTQFHLGAVLVVDDVGGHKKLLGLVTDGDIRRALKQKEKFFTLTAKQFMTASPVSIDEESLAVDALRLMENRPNPLNVLPVTDKNMTAIGLVRLHDLVQKL